MKTNLLRNMLAATVALFTALFALPQTAQAQTTNDLYIAGTQVTSANCNDLSVIDGVSGTVKYDPATKTLTLDNATINAGGNNTGIGSSIDGLTVKLTGTNTVTAKSNAVFHTQPMTIKGSGTLNAESTETPGIYTEETSLTIDGCTVNAKGKWGIAGNDGSSETLTIRNATVTAEGTTGSICDLRTLTLDGCAITNPAGAVWNAEKNAVCDASGNIITDKVTIAPVSTYDLKIAGTQVTSANCNDLSVIDGVSGTMKYEHSTKTLTLDNATINAGGNNNGIFSKIDNLTVKLTGTNTVTAEYSAVFHTQPMTIKGSGTLNAESTNNPGIYTERTSLTIDGCTVNLKGKWGITGNNGDSETLTIRNATVTAEGTAGSICDLRTLTLDGCAITNPAGAVWNAEKYAVCDASGNIIKSKVTIEPQVTTYDLKIAGTQVTSANCNDLSVIDGVSGTVKYEHSTKTLTLDNATINAGGNNAGIVSSIDNLTVKLIGTNTVKVNKAAISHTLPMTIAGGGKLNTESTNNGGIFVKNTSLTIDGCTVNVKGKWGIAGNDGSSETLTIRNATVTAEGTAGSICDFKEFTLDGCKITSPAGAVWNDRKHAVCDASENIIRDKVTIEPSVSTYDLDIAGTQVTSANCNDLSVIDGVSGTVKYDPATKTLTLDNATINAGSNNKGIESSIDGLTVKLTGTNTVTANSAAVFHTQPMTIKGSGTLNAEGTAASGIYTDETSLTIDGCTVNAKGEWGIAGNDGSSETLTIRNATVTAEGTVSSICDLRTLTLDGCAITNPAGAVWNAEKNAVCDASGNIITDKVTIEPSVSTYDVVLEAHNNNKITCIKVVRELTGIGLKEAKDLVESAPCIVLENIAKAKAEAARDKLNTAGGTANIYLHGTWKPTAIEAVTIAVPAGKRGVYNLQGVRLGDSPDRLPAGVYIYNGKKIIKK